MEISNILIAVFIVLMLPILMMTAIYIGTPVIVGLVAFVITGSVFWGVIFGIFAFLLLLSGSSRDS